MGSQTLASAGSSPSLTDLSKAYSDLLDDLSEAYWAANTLEAKDQLYGTIEFVTSIVTQLAADGVDLRNAAYSDLLAKVTNVNTQLQSLQKQIAQLISRITVAATVESDIAKVLGIAAKVVPAL